VRRIAILAIAGALVLGSMARAQTPTSADFSYSPVTPGSWTYREVVGGSEATFIDGAGTTRAVFSCGKVTRLITLSRISTAPAAGLSIWTSSASRDLPSRFDANARRVIAQLGAADSLLDAIALSRGRFALSMAGSPALVLPAGTEIAHIVEDCRS
jgi:hypothetical protein